MLTFETLKRLADHDSLSIEAHEAPNLGVFTVRFTVASILFTAQSDIDNAGVYAIRIASDDAAQLFLTLHEKGALS